MEKPTDYKASVPVDVELPHDTFILLHQDGNSQHLSTFTEVFTDNIVRHVVDFLRGCGHYDDIIYGCMKELAEEYFDYQEENQNVFTVDPSSYLNL
jgi:hypothetical protein